MDWNLLLKPLGIATYILLASNVLIGLFMKKIKLKSKFKLHKWIGIAALLVATMHFILVIIYA